MSVRARLISRPWVRSLALLVPLILVPAAFLAPVGQAHPAAQSSEERENGVVHITCTQVSWTFRGFPNLPANTVTERLSINHQAASFKTFTFDGPEGTDVVAINAPPGPQGAGYQISARARWKTNGFRGGFAIHTRVKCAPAPALSIQTLQKIVGSGGSYTSSPLSGLAGQTVQYEISATNTGNVPLGLSSFSDRCDAGTSSGGPVGAQLAPGASSTYSCTHLLTAPDRAAGGYSNVVSLTATPPEGEGSPFAAESNTVVVELPSSSTVGEEPTPPTTTTTATTTTGTVFTLLPPTPALRTPAQTPSSGVLAFSAVGVPRLRGPQSCVRGPFRATLKAAGVAGVTFYLDGHKLRRLTAANAHKGVLSITVDPSKLSGVGAHRLLARITMVKAPSASKAVTASRTVTVRRCH